MKLQLSRTQRQQLVDWAKEAEPNECCGLLLGHDGIVERIELTANIAKDPSCEFEIDPSALITWEKCARDGGYAILGYFHSHPNGVAEPSVEDARLAAADGRIWFIIADGKITSWRPFGPLQDGYVSFSPEGFVEG